MKTQKYLQAALLAASLATGVACVTQATSGGSNDAADKFTVKINSSEQGVLPQDLEIREVGDFDAPPTLFNFINGSNYVVLAEIEKTEAVAKAGKKESEDVQDLMAGLLHTFKVEKTLCAGDSSKTFKSFQVLVPMSERMTEYYQKGEKYLIFLREIANDDKFLAVYELDKEKPVFRAFEGETSIFPGDGGMHGPPKKGIIKFSDIRYQELIKRIETLTAALCAEGKAAKIENLQKLTSSTDEELKTNAAYAIKTLQTAEK
jgi:hypothetical protein